MELDETKLLAYLSSDERYAAVFFSQDFEASFFEPVEIDADSLEKLFGFERDEAVEFLKKLEELGLGTFMTGRRGKPTRVVIETDDGNGPALQQRLNDWIAARRQGQNKKGKSTTSSVKQLFWLRPDYAVEILLPSDFNQSDCSRMKNWLDTIPFN